MPCATPIGNTAITNGVSDELGLVTNKFQSNRKSDKVEGKDGCGNTVSVAYFNKRHEIDIEGLGDFTGSIDCGSVVSLANASYPVVTGKAIVEELSVARASGENVKFTAKVMAWDGIPD
jgi:hypothetical protein